MHFACKLPTLPLKSALTAKAKTHRRTELAVALKAKGVMAPWSDDYGRLNPPPPYTHLNLCDEFIKAGKGSAEDIAIELCKEAQP